MNSKTYTTALSFIGVGVIGYEMMFNNPCIPGGDKALGFHDCEPAQPHTESQPEAPTYSFVFNTTTSSNSTRLIVL